MQPGKQAGICLVLLSVDSYLSVSDPVEIGQQ